MILKNRDFKSLIRKNKKKSMRKENSVYAGYV